MTKESTGIAVTGPGMARDVRWGLMATGQIAALMAEAARPGRFVAVASRSTDRSRTFADKYGITRSYGSYQALLDDPDVDAVYIARRSRELGGGALGDLGCYCVSAIRLFAGQPEQIYAVGLDDGADVEMRVSATARHPCGVLWQFDIGFDMSRRDQIELIGTDGHITINDPWICGDGGVELVSAGDRRVLDIDPEGIFALTATEADVYRIEIETVSEAIAGTSDLEFGRPDATDQMAAIDAVRKSIEAGIPVLL